MKKVLFEMPIVAVVLMVSIFCSCGNKAKAATDVVVEEPTRLDVDATKEFDRGAVERDLKAFWAEYVNTLNENITPYLSEDFNGVIKKWMSNPYMGEWNLFGLNSVAEIRKYTIVSLSEPVKNRVCAHVKIWIEEETNYYEDKANIYLILAGDKWLVDEIDEVKQNMKKIISENS